MFSFPEQYGATEKTRITNKLTLEVPIQLGPCISNGNTTAYNFMNEESLRNCEFSLPDSIEILSNEKIDVYSFLKYKEFEILKFSL